MSTIPKKVINAAIKYGDRIGNDCDEWLEENDKIDHYALAKNGFLAGYQLATDGENKRIEELEAALKQIAYLKINIQEAKSIAVKSLHHE